MATRFYFFIKYNGMSVLFFAFYNLVGKGNYTVGTQSDIIDIAIDHS